MAAFLGMFQNFLGPVFVAIASGPAFQLSWGPAAELEKLLPMLFHEVENSGDGRFLFFLQAGQAEGLIAVVQIVTVLTVDEAATLGAGHVALVVAGLTEWGVVISGVVSEPDPLAAAGAEGGFILQTLRADEPVVEWDELIRVVNFAAELTGNFVFFHGIVLLDHFPSG